MNDSKRMLLIRVPEIDTLSQNGDLRSSSTAGLSIPLGVATIATAIRKTGLCTPDVLDLYADHYSDIIAATPEQTGDVIETLIRSILAKAGEKHYDYIGFSALFTFQHPLVKRFAHAVRQWHPQVRIFAGGYATVSPEFVLRDIPEIDIVCIGEADISVRQVLQALHEGSALEGIKGVAYRDGDAIKVDARLNLPKDLDALGMPSFDLIDIELYRRIVGRVEAPIVTSRGCPFSCNFCASRLYSAGMHRRQSVDFVLQQLHHLQDTYDVGLFLIRDDNFTANIKHAKGILQRKIAEGITTPWSESSGLHVNSLDEELLSLCKDSGCTEAIFPIESGSPRVLKDIMNKKVDLEHALRMSEHCRKIGLPVQAYFVVGNPGETEEEIQKTVEFALAMKVEHCTFSIATPFPGTRYYEIAVANKYITPGKGTILDLQYMAPNMGTGHISAQRVKDLQYDANIRVNFLENICLSGDRAQLEESLEWFTTVANQYVFHAVAWVLRAYLLERLDQRAEAQQTFLHVLELLQTDTVREAYGKYFDWDTPATNAYRRWLADGALAQAKH